MAASRKKRAKPRATTKARAKKKTRTTASMPAGLKTLDAEWRSFIDHAAHEQPLTKAWPDPKGTPSTRRSVAVKKTAKKKTAKKKAPKKALKKAVKKPAKK